MKKNKKIKIWVIALGFIGMFFIGTLVYRYAGHPSEEVSQISFKKKINPNIELYKRNDVSVKNDIIELYQITNNTWFIKARIVKTEGVGDNLKRSIETFSTNYVRIEKDEFFENLLKIEQQKTITNPPFTLSSLFMNMNNIVFIVFILGSIYLFTRVINRQGFGGKQFKGTEFKKSKVRFTDVAGVETEKKELMEIVDFLKFPKKYINMGARIPKGLLLFGPPGTGKTLLAKAVSGESGVPFFSISGSEFEEVFVGLGASRIRDLFKKAKKEAPCIIFVDEIDSLGSRRNKGMGNVSDQTLNQFLSAMDGFESNEGVVIIGATNRLEILDPALLRSGRFDRKININLPDVKEREAILKIHTRKKKISSDVDFVSISEKTPGFSGADLENALNEAALLAVRKDKNIIEKNDISEGIDRVIAGPAKIGKIINQKSKIIFSIHEAGHALIGLILDEAMRVQKITIIPRGNAGGYTITTPKDETLANTKKTLEERLIGLLGGRCAEEIIFGKENVTTGAYDDFDKATKIAEQMVKKFGMSNIGVRFFEKNIQSFGQELGEVSEKTKEEIDKSINGLLEKTMNRAREIIKKELKLLFLISETLLILETISREDVEYIYKEKKIPLKAKERKEKTNKKYLDFSFFGNIPGKDIKKKFEENEK